MTTMNGGERHPLEDVNRVQEFLGITFEAMAQGITIYDSDLCLVAWNGRYSEMGITPPRHLHYGASLVDLYIEISTEGVFGPGDPRELAQRHVDMLRDGPLISSEILTPPTGRSIRIHRYRLPNGGICATFDDITEQLRAETELRQAQKLESIGQLTGGVAHDFNNRLAVIQASLELALEKGVNVDAAGLIRMALDASERGAKFADRLLAFARGQPVASTTTDIGTLLSGLESMIKGILGESIRVEIVRPPGLWPCSVDPNQLENVVLNLAVNARDSMPEGGDLTVQVANETVRKDDATPSEPESSKYVCVSVTDTGSGMDTETVGRACEPFFTTKPVGHGTGLGLSMAHGFVTQSKGYIEILSEVGEGTTIKLYLPRASAESGQVVTGEVQQLTPLTGLGTVLVVEDDEALRPLVVCQLESLGYEARSASNGADALVMIEGTTDVDFLLSDVRLPGGMSGYDLAEAAKASKPGLPVVLMSGDMNSTSTHKGMLVPHIDLLQKPFGKARLAHALRACRRSR